MRWREQARVVVVYLREAHAMDEWPMGCHVQVSQATTLDDRAESARHFKASTRLQVDAVFIDGLEDGFMHLMSAHPQRFFVVDSTGVLRLKAMPFEGGYSLEDVDRCLSELHALPEDRSDA